MGFIELNVLNNQAKSVALGIDLGTTNSLGAVWQDGRPHVLHPAGENGSVPSAFYFKEDGTVLIGRSARAEAALDPAHALFSVKRFLGRGLKDVEADLSSVPCPVSETASGVIEFEMRGRKYTPQQLSALILMRVHDLACQALGVDIRQAVITVPAYFDDNQRQATRDAARLAGLEVLRIVNEPTAASLAYGLDQKEASTVAVYDLGGGTFDVSVLSIEDGVFRVLSTSGDTHLGGDDFDRALVALALEELEGVVDAETRADRAFHQLLRLAAEKCKIELSVHPEGELHITLPESSVQWRRRVTRDELESRTAELVERTIDACRQALSDADLTTDRIDEVVLVGGATRMPHVRAAVAAFFGRPPHTEFNPDEVVALGAAAQAHVLKGGTRDLLLMDVTPLSLGIETMGGAVAKLILRNTTIPCQATEGFTTYVDNQTGIDFHVVQGERELAEDCRSLGRFKLTGIPPMPAGLARVAVRFHIDANGVLTVTAKEQSTGAQASIEATPMNGLSDGEVETMLEQSYANAQRDFDRSRFANLVVEAGTMLRAAERGLEQYRDALDAETVADVEEALAALRKASEGDDLAELQKQRDVAERATLPLAAVMMDDVAKRALSGKSLEDL